jgi:hypothetical protein
MIVFQISFITHHIIHQNKKKQFCNNYKLFFQHKKASEIVYQSKVKKKLSNLIKEFEIFSSTLLYLYVSGSFQKIK